LAWTEDGTMVLRISATTISTFKQSPVQWKQTASIELPLKDYFRFSELASDGTNVIGDYENSYTPPEIFSYRSKEKEVSVISRLNPQFDHLTLATAKPVRWTTSNGYSVEGFLFVPPGYKQEEQYPLVIQTKAYEGQFACDTGYNHYPSFAPQPIANADMMYLVRTYPEKWRENDEVQHYPSGYPGGVSEAAFQMDIWDSAVRELASQGLVDINRVGIIGFSRTGWYTEFILTHSSIPYRAATLTDNVQYNLPEYWNLRTPSTLRGWDAMYGGPPFGQTLQNWIDYSASFHLEKVHAAVLMEEMGYGIQFDDPKKPPLYLSTAMDWFTGLTSLSRPIEMYYYPNEDHQPDHPKARLATLQRNVDWYRFWLDGQERNAPSTDTQYRRWEGLRREQHSDSPEPF
jgi:dipeptidyl aminopeptidase/acylaminoacyl peptidase